MTKPKPERLKTACSIPNKSWNCPKECVGIFGSLMIQGFNESYIVQVCPNPELVGAPNTEVLRTDSPSLILLHRKSQPTPDEYNEAVEAFGTNPLKPIDK